MHTTIQLSRQWVTLGASSGIVANLLFPALLLVSFPSALQIFFTALFGILFALCGFGIHQFLKHERSNVLTQIAALFVFVSGFLFNLMLVVQQVFKGYLEHFRAQMLTVGEMELLGWITKAVDPIHMAMQLSNDFFCAIAMILFAIVMHRHSIFGRPWSISGLVIATTLLSIKCYAFPFTPQEVGIPYFIGPLVALWFLAVCVRCLQKKEHLPNEEAYEVFV